MERRQFLLTLLGTLLLVVGVSVGVTASPTFACTLEEQVDQGCPTKVSAENVGNEAVVKGESKGRAANVGEVNDPEGTGQVYTPPAKAPPRATVPGSEDTPGQDNWVPPAREQCLDAPDVCNPSLVISLSDIAAFKASIPVLAQMQPSGWALKNLPMNLVAQASVEEISGELLGFPASVRFTPVSYVWDYGDGTTGTSVTGGASWEALGVPELTKTATSHAYRERGEYAVTVSVVLSAEYRFAGQPWRPIAGTLQIDGAASPVSVKTVRTVLVRGTCLQYPNDPGC